MPFHVIKNVFDYLYYKWKCGFLNMTVSPSIKEHKFQLHSYVMKYDSLKSYIQSKKYGFIEITYFQNAISF